MQVTWCNHFAVVKQFEVLQYHINSWLSKDLDALVHLVLHHDDAVIMGYPCGWSVGFWPCMDIVCVAMVSGLLACLSDSEGRHPALVIHQASELPSSCYVDVWHISYQDCSVVIMYTVLIVVLIASSVIQC